MKILLYISILTLYPLLLHGQNSFRDLQNRYPRVRQARENRVHYLDSLFSSKGLEYPPHNIAIIVYKQEQILELWARPETTKTFTQIKQYPFTAFCGMLGPKRKRGDLQIPEGFYELSHFNPYSNFHLSMLVSYPNRSDDILSPYNDLGGEIRIHGSCVTIGCIPIGDESIEELYITCVDVKSQGQQHIPVYIFPNHMDYTGMLMLQDLMQADKKLQAFWRNLKQGYDIFSSTHKAIDCSINDQGIYIFTNMLYEYPWQTDYTITNCLVNRIIPPAGYHRILTPVFSFAAWLQNLPLKHSNPSVRLYDGTLKSYQGGHAAVVDIDVGTKDLQQCADAIIRLYAEYLYSMKAYDKISFQITNGDTVLYRTWINGYRPTISNNTVNWNKTAIIDSSYRVLRKYMDFIFSYAGSYSLSQQIKPVYDMNIGDIFIQGGFPGHAVMVMDMAVNPQTNDTIFLLAQSYMPAQDFHILKNLSDPLIDPWYDLNFGDTLHTPEWTFFKDDLKRF